MENCFDLPNKAILDERERMCLRNRMMVIDSRKEAQ